MFGKKKNQPVKGKSEHKSLSGAAGPTEGKSDLKEKGEKGQKNAIHVQMETTGDSRSTQPPPTTLPVTLPSSLTSPPPPHPTYSSYSLLTTHFSGQLSPPATIFRRAAPPYWRELADQVLVSSPFLLMSSCHVTSSTPLFFFFCRL